MRERGYIYMKGVSTENQSNGTAVSTMPNIHAQASPRVSVVGSLFPQGSSAHQSPKHTGSRRQLAGAPPPPSAPHPSIKSLDGSLGSKLPQISPRTGQAGSAASSAATGVRLAATEADLQSHETEADASRAEIRRALAAVAAAQQRRAAVAEDRASGERGLHGAHKAAGGAGGESVGEPDQASSAALEKLKKRQEKKEELARKRAEMEERLRAEEARLSALTGSVKRNAQQSVATNEARQEAEAHRKAEAELLIKQQQEAAAALIRAAEQRAAAVAEAAKAAEIEAQKAAQALQAKRADLEAAVKAEEGELLRMSEEAKQKVAGRMRQEAEAIAAMQRQAEAMASERAKMEQKLGKEDEGEAERMKAQAEALRLKREELESSMVLQEQEIQRLGQEAKTKMEQKMREEAEAIAVMERQALDIAARRELLAAQVANDQAWADYEEAQRIAAEAALAEAKLAEEASYAGISPEPEAINITQDGETVQPKLGASLVKAHGSLYDFFAAGAGTDDTIEEWDEEDRASACDDESTKHQHMNSLVCSECRDRASALPTAHHAAALGHVTCLRALCESLGGAVVGTGLDAAGRPPLFYACANGHEECVILLLAAAPETVMVVDANGKDSVLHAAAASGSSSVVSLLLQDGQLNTDVTNALGMRPAHLAASIEVLEALLDFGADLNVTDMEGRSPLFLACATNRVEVAEYLCELLDSEGADLAQADKRGDTPLHAAACNGATACLLLLLQYGCIPDCRNIKRLRPIDLASRRGHAAAEKVLLEYHLHHQISDSNFDSILFLAALEGHRKAKAALKEAMAATKKAPDMEEELYEIVKLAGAANGTNKGSKLSHVKSLWSLQRGKSMRLQQWGDWIAYEDQTEGGRQFWYNHVSKATCFSTPEEVEALQRAHGLSGLEVSSSDDIGGDPADGHGTSMRLKREGDWIAYTITDGKTFYYNDRTHEFQWSRPEDLVSGWWSSNTANTSQHPTTEHINNNGDAPVYTDAAVNNTDAPGATYEDEEWEAFTDADSGLVFWYSHFTGVSQWESPFTVVAGGAQTAGEENFGESPHTIQNVDELFT